MKPEFNDDYLAHDPLDAPDQDFNWQELYERLNEDASSGQNDPRLSGFILRLLQMLLPPSRRRIQLESLGLRLIALAWVLSPGYFEGNPSIRRLARRCGVRTAALAVYTGHYSRLLQWRNRGQRHAWNWLRQGTPSHRGESAQMKLKRNVPASREGQSSGSGRRPKAGASGREKRPTPPATGTDLPQQTNAREPAANR